jgi:hypothetical protein
MSKFSEAYTWALLLYSLVAIIWFFLKLPGSTYQQAFLRMMSFSLGGCVFLYIGYLTVDHPLSQQLVLASLAFLLLFMLMAGGGIFYYWLRSKANSKINVN